MADIVAGHADLYCATPTSAAEQVRAGTAKGYGITARERIASLPAVPTSKAVVTTGKSLGKRALSLRIMFMQVLAPARPSVTAWELFWSEV